MAERGEGKRFEVTFSLNTYVEGLGADDLAVGVEALDCSRDPGDEATTTDRHNHSVQVGYLNGDIDGAGERRRTRRDGQWVWESHVKQTRQTNCCWCLLGYLDFVTTQ